MKRRTAAEWRKLLDARDETALTGNAWLRVIALLLVEVLTELERKGAGEVGQR